MPEYKTQSTEGDFVLYHWSPKINREAIQQQGLRIRSKATQGEWRPPFVTFALSPHLAWLLSAARDDYEVQHDEWDLWSVWADRVNQWEALFFDGRDGTTDGIKELRVYRSIPAKYLWRVGTRSRSDDAVDKAD